MHNKKVFSCHKWIPMKTKILLSMTTHTHPGENCPDHLDSIINRNRCLITMKSL